MPALADIEAAIRPPTGAFPKSALLCLENSHNNCGGSVVSAEETRAAAELAHRHGMAVHLDGARLFNAAAALGVDASVLAAPVDTVQFCFSKGLGAPVGSILCGPRDTIARARKVRKLLGGAMRQAGVIAAAALVSLETMRERLVEDNRNARTLADGLAAIRGIHIDPARVVTNIVSFEVDPATMAAGDFQRTCAEPGPADITLPRELSPAADGHPQGRQRRGRARGPGDHVRGPRRRPAGGHRRRLAAAAADRRGYPVPVGDPVVPLSSPDGGPVRPPGR